MIYVTSDIHGKIAPFTDLLDAIDIDDPTTTLFVLGDCVDYGENGIQVLMQMAQYDNIIPMMGNHEFVAAKTLTRLMKELTDTKLSSITEVMMVDLMSWFKIGGEPTLKEFYRLSMDTRYELLNYLCKFVPYNHLGLNGTDYILVHAGLGGFSPDRALKDYMMHELMFEKTDYSVPYYDDKIVITGHTPTFQIPGATPGKIYRSKGHIAIDCGIAFGHSLGCLCLNTGEEMYFT